MSEAIERLYFGWLCSKVYAPEPYSPVYYERLLKALHGTEFRCCNPKDLNRYDDGVALRYLFGREQEIEDPIIASVIDIRPCSVLEMMVALADRMDFLMYDISFGSRTGEWFWGMVRSMGLLGMTDDKFDRTKVNDIIRKMIDYKFRPSGHGGLFELKCRNIDVDMRTLDIWYQMHAYLKTILND